MRKFKVLFTVVMSSLLLVQPILADTVAKNTEDVKVEQGVVNPVAPETVEAIELQPATEVKKTVIEVKKPVKTFQLKPRVINGVSYVSVKDLEKHLGIKSKLSGKNNGISLFTPVSQIYISDHWSAPQVNRQWLPCNSRVKTFNGVPYVPAKFVLENTNCTVSYETKNNTLTVNYFGDIVPKLVDTQMNTIKGKIVDANGKPVSGINVYLDAMKEDGSSMSTNAGGDNPNLPPVVTTDENGNYEFAPLDTVKYPRVSVTTNYVLNGVPYEGYTPGTFSKEKGALEDGFLRVNSKLETMPTIHTYENKW